MASKSSSNSILVSLLSLSLFSILLVFGNSIISIQSVEAKYVLSKKWGTVGSGDGQFQMPRGVTIDSAGTVYVTDGYEEGDIDRVQKFKLASPCPAGTTQVATGVCFVTKWGSEGSANGQFEYISGISTDSAGNVYVADNGNSRIQVFDQNGNFIKAWEIGNPGHIAIDSSHNIYVTDSNWVQKFKLATTCPAGTTQVATGVCFVTKWGSESAAGIDVDSLGIVYVADNHNHKIHAFTSNGIPILSWGTFGSGDGQLNRPGGLAVDSFGYVYVSENFNHRISKFQLTPNPCPTGTIQITTYVCFITKWGNHGSGDGQFDIPAGVAAGPKSIFVAGHKNPNIQEFYWKTDIGGPIRGGTNMPDIGMK